MSRAVSHPRPPASQWAVCRAWLAVGCLSDDSIADAGFGAQLVRDDDYRFISDRRPRSHWSRTVTARLHAGT
jgi:hypothetical protein